MKPFTEEISQYTTSKQVLSENHRHKDELLMIKISIQNLSVYYGNFRAVKEASLEVTATSQPSSGHPAAANLLYCAASIV
jgi:hypothetical protein